MSKLIREYELADIAELDILYHSGGDRVEIVALLITREMVRLTMEPDEARRELPYTADQVYHGVRNEYLCGYLLGAALHANDKRAHELILAAVREDNALRKIMNRWLKAVWSKSIP